jgi:hypothetical protein
MSSKTAWAYVAGAAVGITVGFLTAGLGFAAYAGIAGMLAFSATASIMMMGGMGGQPGMMQQQSLGKQSSNTVKNAASAELDIASASEAVTVPVIFGSVKLPGNYLRYAKSTFKTVPIIQTIITETPVIVQQQAQQQSGGKGGASSVANNISSNLKPSSGATKKTVNKQVVGYNYYLSWDYGLCMGPLHSLRRIYDGSTQKKMSEPETAFGSSNSIVRNISGGGTGGRIRVYKGSDDQPRVSGEPYFNEFSRYRHVAYVSFQNFHLGQQAAPKTYLFEVLRFPICLDANGDVITELANRGSANTSHPCYRDANPAAILYEVLTNGVWGRGLSPDLLDIQSFVDASIYFRDRNLGLSLSIEAQDVLSTVMEQIRQHCNTAVVWTGNTLRCVVLSNTTATDAVPVATIRRDQVHKVGFTRPAWPDITNELRVEFVNRANNYKPEIAHIQDDAAIAAAGLINSQKIMLPGFSNRETAEREAQRILGELSTPRASIRFSMNRWDSHLTPGDLFRFVWNEWSGQPTTTFWRVAEIRETEDIEEGIEVSAQEDLYNAAYFGEPEPFTAPTPPWLNDTSPTDEDLYLDDDKNEPLDAGDLEPVRLFEPPIFISSGEGMLALTAEQPEGYVIGLQLSWSLAAADNYTFHAAFTNPWAVNGELTTDIPEHRRSICRVTGDEFSFSLENPDNEDVILASANKVELSSDDLQTLTNGGTDLLLVGREIILLGNVTETSPGVYTATNYLRGAFGSYREEHLTGHPVAFLEAWEPVFYTTPLGTIPLGEALDLAAYAATTSGLSDTPALGSATLEGLSRMPYAAEIIESVKISDDWTITLRPRWHDRGFQVEADLFTDLNSLTTAIPEGYAWRITPYNGASPSGPAEVVAGLFHPDDGQSPNTGLLELEYSAPAGTDSLRIHTTLNGIPSLAAAIATA